MEIQFCSQRKIDGCELMLLAIELGSTVPKIEDYVLCKDEGDVCDIIVYQIDWCRGMANLNMNAKMSEIISCFHRASEKHNEIPDNPEWIHIYFGLKNKFLAYLNWKPYQYFTENAYNKLID